MTGRYRLESGDGLIPEHMDSLFEAIAIALLKAYERSYIIYMASPYDFGRSVDFAVVDPPKGRRKKERFIYVVQCQAVRNDLK